jgi:hypothetical protein
MISEKTIEQTIAQFESDQVDYEKAIREFSGRQPAIVSFLLADHEGALTDAEQEYLMYLANIIFRSVEAEEGELPKATPNEVTNAEEKNWDLLGQSKSRNFRERLDVFFANTDQEDLLAFIEDSLVEDEEAEEVVVTDEGREPMFVLLKTVVDVLSEK